MCFCFVMFFYDFLSFSTALMDRHMKTQAHRQLGRLDGREVEGAHEELFDVWPEELWPCLHIRQLLGHPGHTPYDMNKKTRRPWSLRKGTGV